MKKYIILCFLTILNQILFSQAKVEMIITAPAVLDSEKLFISGNHKNLGYWDPGLISLARTNDSTWIGHFVFPINTALEFKFTKGDWSTEALDNKGMVPGNTILHVQSDTVIFYKVTKWGKTNPIMQGNITGQVKYHLSFAGKDIPSRDIIVWLPPSYDSLPYKNYPVLYMHDGQNIFDPLTSAFGADWQIDETADSLIKDESMQEIIIVGIYNTNNRRLEYTPTEIGAAYMNFILNKLKPFIDYTYRTLPDRNNTAIGGSSLGGLISFMILFEHSDIFSKAACLSPAFKIENLDYVAPVKKYIGSKKEIQIYIDNGGIGLEEKLQPGIDEMLVVLKEKDYELGKDFIWFKDASAEHNEKAWAKRVYRFLEFFFPHKKLN